MSHRKKRAFVVILISHLLVCIEASSNLRTKSVSFLFQTENTPKPTTTSSTTTTTTTALPCQLLGMNCAQPTDFSFSFTGFACRGGDTDIHSDGWGLAFYEGRGLRMFQDPEPCSDSVVADLVKNYPVKTLNMMAHIRYATAGVVCLENVHPFQREMWGIQWCFAHNGDCAMFKDNTVRPWLGDTPGEHIYNPVGDTDSELIFCTLLNALKAKFETLPTLPLLHETIQSLCQEIVQSDPQTILNFLLGCGEHIQFAYSWPGSRPGSTVWNGLHYTVREPPFRKVRLRDTDYSVNFAEVTTDDDRVAVVATVPLTDDEEWVELGRGELILFDQGLPHMAPVDCVRAELRGHGLDSDVIPRPSSPSLLEDMRRYRKKKSYFAGVDI